MSSARLATKMILPTTDGNSGDWNYESVEDENVKLEKVCTSHERWFSEHQDLEMGSIVEMPS